MGDHSHSSHSCMRCYALVYAHARTHTDTLKLHRELLTMYLPPELIRKQGMFYIVICYLISECDYVQERDCTIVSQHKIRWCPITDQKSLFFSKLYYSKSNFSATTFTGVHRSSLDVVGVCVTV